MKQPILDTIRIFWVLGRPILFLFIIGVVLIIFSSFLGCHCDTEVVGEKCDYDNCE